MPTYKFTIEMANAKIFAHCMQIIMRWAKLYSIEYLDGEPLTAPLTQTDLPTRKPYTQLDAEFYHDRNEEIIAKYTADPKAHSCGKLAVEYGITRERVCQILRPVNAIGNAQARREAAREANAEAAAKLKEETNAALEAKIVEVFELIRGGKSIRAAAMAANLEPHSNLTNLISRRCKLAGIKIDFGRHRDFSKRKARVRTLAKEGLSVNKIVEKMRATGDPHIYPQWVYNNIPEVKQRKE